MTTKASEKENRGILKSVLSMSGITFGSRILGLVREQVRAHYLGTTLSSDAFGIAFQLPNLLRRLVGEGAMSAALIPVLNDLKQQEGEKTALIFARQFFNLSLWFLSFLSCLGIFGAAFLVEGFAFVGGQSIALESRVLTTSLTALMFPYIALVSWAAVAQGILNTYRIFWVSALTSIFLNISIIASALIFAQQLDEPSYAFCGGVLLGGLAQFVFQIPFVYRLGFRWRPDFRWGGGVKRALRLLVPTLFGAGIYQINVLVSQAVAWGVGKGAVSSLQYSSRLLELTLGIFAVALSTVILPSLSADVSRGAIEKVEHTVLFGVRLTCLVCFPVTLGLFLTRRETVSLLFERGSFDVLSTVMTSDALMFHIPGLTLIALCRVLVPVFYAHHDTKRPVIAAFLSMVVNIVACYALAPQLKQAGIACANSLSALVQCVALVVLVGAHLKISSSGQTLNSLAKSALATMAMGGVVVGLQEFFNTAQKSGFSELVFPYTLTVLAAVLTFAATGLLLKHPEMQLKRILSGNDFASRL
jgi:putative peptidoglycan lipid II flippase